MSEQTESRIIFPTGHHASGKTELCEYLTERHGFDVIETGSMMRQLYNAREEKYEGLSIQEYVKHTVANDEGFFDRQLEAMIKEIEQDSGLVVVNGMRTYENVEKILGTRPNAVSAIIWLDASAEVLHQRYLKREGNQISFEEFCELLELDLSLGLGDIERNADYRIDNEGSIDDLRSSFDTIMLKLGNKAIELS